MNDDPLMRALGRLPRIEAPRRTAKRTQRRALSRFGRPAPSVVMATLAHAALALLCLAYLIALVLVASGLYA